MGRFFLILLLTLLIIGSVFTFDIPLHWIGNLPGDFSLFWGKVHIFVPITTSVFFSLLLAVFLYFFSRR